MRHTCHKLTYVEMYPEPLSTNEPGGLKIIGGAFVAVAFVYLLTVFAFSL